MTRVAAYDGKSARKYHATLQRKTGCLVLSFDNSVHSYDVMRITTSEPVTDAPRWIYFNDGWACELPDSDFKALIPDPQTDLRTRLLRFLHDNRFFLIPVLALNLALIWLLVQFEIPHLVNSATRHLSLLYAESSDRRTLQSLDGRQFAKSRLLEAEQRRLQAVFQQWLKKSQRKNRDKTDRFRYRLVFRDAPGLGANALGLPSGTIIITDQLVKLSRSDRQLMAVIAHEVGHIRHRHIIRSRFSASASTLIYGHLLRDTSVLSTIALSTPDRLLNQRYSESEELEADAFAIRFLKANRTHARELLFALHTLHRYTRGRNAVFYHQRYKQPAAKGIKVNYFNTHPHLQQRLEQIRRLSRKKRRRGRRHRRRYRLY